MTDQARQDRAERFARRLDDHLPTLPDDDARHAFLASQEARWLRLYAEWQADVAANRADLTGDHPTAFDFVETLAAIGTRKARYERVAA